MVSVIKSKIKKIASILDKWPVIGRLIRIGVAIIRLPDANHTRDVFEQEQLPTLLKTLSNLNYRQIASDSDIDNLVKSVPVALRKITRDLVDIRRQIESVSKSVNYLLGRVEFVRRELMFEMHYGASSFAGESDQIKAKPRILSPEQLVIARNAKLRVNLGYGHFTLSGYINVDRRALPGVDVIADIDQLPFKNGEVDEFFSVHLLEHFPQEQLQRELLPYFFNLLSEGGKFSAIVTDVEAMILEYSIGNFSYDDIHELIYGSQYSDGEFNFNIFTPTSLEKLFVSIGFKKVEIVKSSIKEGKYLDYKISAFKSEKE